MRAGLPCTYEDIAQPERTQSCLRSRKCQPSSPASIDASLNWSLSPRSSNCLATSEVMKPSPWRDFGYSFWVRTTP